VLTRIALYVTICLAAAGNIRAGTAYDALQVIKKAKGDGILKKLVEVRGETGQPQPPSWTILMSDPTARGGVREFVVVGAEIASESTPLHNSSIAALPVLDFTRLNLDSDGAFKVADAEASRQKVGFHTINYTLRTDEATGAPIWSVHLFDYMGAPVGDLQVSAENGKVVDVLKIDPDAREQQTAGGSRSQDDSGGSTHFKGGVFGFVERTVKNVGTKTKEIGTSVGQTVRKTTLNVAGSVQEVLTGERTIDGGESSPSPTPSR